MLSLDVCLELQLWRALLLRCRNSSHPSSSGSSKYSSQASPSLLTFGCLARPETNWQMSCRLVEKEEDTFSTRMRVVVSTLVMFRYSKPHPSRPSTRRFQTTRCPLRYRCMGMHFSLLSSICRRRFLLSYATSGLVPSCPRLAALSACTLELVLPVNRGCFACDRQHEMKHMSKDGNTRCLEAQLSHTA